MSYRIFHVCLALVVCLGGCSPSPILRQIGITESNVVTTGARQRAIIRTNIDFESRTGHVFPQTITCVEPSPDVAGTVASAVGFGAGVFGYGSGSISGAQQEGLFQLGERTVAIQSILRQGYQNCLDFANGAITSATYSVRSARLDDLIATLVLSEIAGGAFGRSGGSLSASGARADAAASASAGVSELVEGVEEVSGQLVDANQRVTEAEHARALAQERVTANPQDAEAREDLENAETALQRAREERDALEQLLQDRVAATTSATAGTITAVGSGGLSATPNPQIAAVIEQLQENFLSQGGVQGYVTACIVELAAHAPFPPDQYTSGYMEATLQQIQNIVDARVRGGDPRSIITDDLRPFLIGANAARRSTLVQHCSDNLNSVVTTLEQHAQANRVARAAVDVAAANAREADARRAALAQFNQSLQACQALEEAEREDCIASIRAIFE